jgi:Na+-driven multidrug efflux pump
MENNKFDKEIELTKIELYSEHIHSRYMTMLPSMIAIYLAFIIAFWTFYFEGVLTIEGFFIALFAFSIPNFIGFYRFVRKFKKNIKKI